MRMKNSAIRNGNLSLLAAKIKWQRATRPWWFGDGHAENFTV